MIRDIEGRPRVEAEVEAVEPEVDIIKLIIKKERKKEDESKLGVDLLYYLRTYYRP